MRTAAKLVYLADAKHPGVVTVLVVWTKAVVVSAQWTPSERLWNVPAVLTGHVGVLSNSSGDRSSWTFEPCKRSDAGAATGLVTVTLRRGRARRERLSLVAREPEGSTPDPTVTVVICAHTENRSDDLLAVVTSVKQQIYRPAEIVLVIDHNPKLQRRSTFELPGVKVIPNDNEKGLTGARYAGIAAAASEIVAFLDDATVAAHNWLAALVAPYADPHVLGGGGQVVPAWPTERPGWFPSEFRVELQSRLCVLVGAGHSSRHNYCERPRGMAGRARRSRGAIPREVAYRRVASVPASTAQAPSIGLGKRNPNAPPL